MPLTASFTFWQEFVLAVLATWRLTHLLSSEDGPADLLFRFRKFLGPGLVGQMLDCFYCLSLWVAVPPSFLFALHPWDWLLTWLAISAGACLLEHTNQQPVVFRNFDSEGDMSHGMLRAQEGQPQDQSVSHHERD
jgi:hypothetical protein